MTRLWIWFLMNNVSVTAAFFGAASWRTFGVVAGVSGLALSLHWLFGEDA
jgi:hypothetical protein